MEQKQNAVFGPVASRRLGLSLGIDLLNFKTCSLNCVYCELGLTSHLTMERGRFRDYQDVLGQVEERLTQLDTPPDSLTLAGSGEPTLHMDLSKTLQGLRTISPIRRVVLTNSTLMHLPEVRRDLSQADIVVPSLDAVSMEVFNKLNQPAAGLNPQAMVDGLIRFRQQYAGQIWLEILLVKGINDHQAELELLRRAVKDIAPDILQLNTIVRPPAVSGFLPVPQHELEQIADSFELPAQVAGQSAAQPSLDAAELKNIITQTTNMRPCTMEDLMQISGHTKQDLEKALAELLADGHLQQEDFDGRAYFRGVL